MVIHFSCAYRMVVDTLAFHQRTTKIKVVSIPVVYPVTSEQAIIDSFVQELHKHEKVTMCVFDHVSSMVNLRC